MKLIDAFGGEIQDGQTLERVKERRTALVGNRYTVEKRKWDASDKHESLVANGIHINELLDKDRAKEFKIVR